MVSPDPSTVRFTGPWRHHDVRANGVRLHAVECADQPSSDRPLVLLMHGFGEFWWSWRHQLPALTAAGYRAVAVDLRGYGDSDKPPRGYDGWTLAGDTDGLIRALGHADATIVGHADGGLVCWATATLHPRSVRSMAVIASPHPQALKDASLRDRAQRKAFLAGFLRAQIPRTAERDLVRDDGAMIEEMMRSNSGLRWPMTDDFADAAARNRSAIQIAGVAHCSLEYRRWAFRSQFRPDGSRFLELMDKRLQIPVLAIRGELDNYIRRPTLAASAKWAAHLDLTEIAGSGHYAHQEAPDEVNRQLIEFAGR
ncbi:alpha/beta fold hydrolase [Williamsia limnetica]|uniref:alpha/beta fold hydrolase n=1 Tax=Williamsia limnetica TaxID=882452 RepID=UPI000D7C7E52|nr:alpha/beta hydrolase [Williamsia limnetica]